MANWPKLRRKKRQKPEQAKTAEPRHLEGVPETRKMNMQSAMSKQGPTPPAGGQTAKENSTQMKMTMGGATASEHVLAIVSAMVASMSTLWKKYQ